MVRRNEEGKESATVHFHWYGDLEEERLGKRLEIKYCRNAKRKREQFQVILQVERIFKGE